MPNTMLHQLGATMIDEEKYEATIDTPQARQVLDQGEVARVAHGRIPLHGAAGALDAGVDLGAQGGGIGGPRRNAIEPGV